MGNFHHLDTKYTQSETSHLKQKVAQTIFYGERENRRELVFGNEEDDDCIT